MERRRGREEGGKRHSDGFQKERHESRGKNSPTEPYMISQKYKSNYQDGFLLLPELGER